MSNTKILYHGSNIEIQNPFIKTESFAKDFGFGFYCTELHDQAVRWAKRFEAPVINVYEYTIVARLKILEFNQMNDEWLDFIVQCRNKNSHSFDIVSGAMANDQVWNYIADYIDGILTKEQFWVLAQFKYPTHQIAFCTAESLQCLRFIKKVDLQ